MSLRAILSFTLLCVLALACKNEPYQYPPLGVTAFLNHDTNGSNSYSYRGEKLWTAATALGSMRFYYAGDDLSRIVTDSIATSKKVTLFYRSGSIIIDSTFLVDAVSRALVSTRTVNYNEEGNPLSVDIQAWAAGAATHDLAELTWENGNVTRLSTFDLSKGGKALVTDVIIGHDDHPCIFMENNNYLFTFALTELYWLSNNNPTVFTEGETEKKYTYWYNKLGYPSNFRNTAGQLYGITYKQIR